PWRVDFEYGVGRTLTQVVNRQGIADERAYYYPTTGLLRVIAGRREIALNDLTTPPYRGALVGRAYARSNAPISVQKEIGFFGYFADATPVIDRWAISDAFLARIPYRPGEDGHFRIGHFERRLPERYIESRVVGRNLLGDPALAHLYDQVQLVTAGPL